MLKQNKAKNGDARLTLCSLPPSGKRQPKLGILKGPHGYGYHPVVSFSSKVFAPNKVLIINVNY